MDRFEQELSAAKGQRNEEWFKERLGKITWSRAGTWMSKSQGYKSVYKKVEELEAQLRAINSGALDKEINALAMEIKEKQEKKRGTITLERKLDDLRAINKPRVEEELKAAKKELYMARFSKTCLTYVYSKVAEIMSGQSHDITGQAIMWGEDNEAEALDKLELYLDRPIERIGYVAYNEYSGGSADGITGEDLVEVKCPFDPSNHVQSMLTKKVYNEDHMWQIQGNLLSTKKRGCYYVTYDPRVLEPALQLNVIYIERDEEMIAQIKERLIEVHDLLQSLLSEINDSN